METILNFLANAQTVAFFVIVTVVAVGSTFCKKDIPEEKVSA